MSVFNCEFCGVTYKQQKRLITHQSTSTTCIKLQVKKLGKPLTEINKEKKAKVEAPVANVEPPKPVVEDESSSNEDEINFTEIFPFHLHLKVLLLRVKQKKFIKE